uniref:Uncharacterized protein n=1 Tax=Daphnia galeata TaxID=27404 RepID=A0A8J2S4V0_9CRUS|nr:unnamed protein product [Daphnia galeata]
MRQRHASGQQQQQSQSCEVNMISQDLNDLISKLKKLPGPIVLIWLPYGENTFGHAALLTDEYYISFWPSKGKRIAEISKTSAVGRLHFHVKEDFEAEGNRVPTLHEIVNVTNQQINDEYVQFLVYNGINPTEVSLAAAENLTGQWRMDLARTSYSFVGNVIVEKVPVECLFYHKPQSCVSFCFNLIEMADPKPLVCLIEARKNHSLWPVLDSLLGMCLEISVPNFEEHIVKKYWLKGCKRERYNVLVFQKRTLSVMLMGNLFKKILTSLPTIFVLQLLQSVPFSVRRMLQEGSAEGPPNRRLLVTVYRRQTGLIPGRACHSLYYTEATLRPRKTILFTTPGITRSARFWLWDRWTSNPPQATEPKTGFRKYPVDFTNGQKKVSKKNNTYAVLPMIVLNDSSSA